jgi:hypothetical protein
MGPLVLLKNFTVVLDVGQAFFTDWTAIPSQHQNGTLHAHVQTLSPPTPAAGFVIRFQGSFDTVEESDLGAGITVQLVNSYNDSLSQNIAPLGRLKISNAETGPISGIVSIWLQPKSE